MDVMDSTTDLELLKLYAESGIDETYGDAPHNFFEIKNNFLNAISGNSYRAGAADSGNGAVVGSGKSVAEQKAALSIARAVEEAQKVASAAGSVAELCAGVRAFSLSPLSKFATNAITGVGVDNPKLLVITDIPNSDEDRSGVVLSGATGELLVKILSAIECSVGTNTYTFPASFLRPAGGRVPTREELNIFTPFIKRFVELLKPKFIMLMGAVPVEAVLGKTDAITSLCGKMFEYNGVPVMPTFSLNFLNNNKDAKRKVWQDLQTVIIPKLREVG